LSEGCDLTIAKAARQLKALFWVQRMFCIIMLPYAERWERAMKFIFNHNNFNVLDLEKSLNFYKEALGLVETRQIEPPDRSFKLVFLGDGSSTHKVELTWLRNRTEPYNLGDNEFHLALTVDDYEAAFAHHKKMGCVCYENPTMGIYFIEDPDGYWIEILPERK
jgi:lactoylglutathione lyase